MESLSGCDVGSVNVWGEGGALDEEEGGLEEEDGDFSELEAKDEGGGLAIEVLVELAGTMEGPGEKM